MGIWDTRGLLGFVCPRTEIGGKIVGNRWTHLPPLGFVCQRTEIGWKLLKSVDTPAPPWDLFAHERESVGNCWESVDTRGLPRDLFDHRRKSAGNVRNLLRYSNNLRRYAGRIFGVDCLNITWILWRVTWILWRVMCSVSQRCQVPDDAMKRARSAHSTHKQEAARVRKLWGSLGSPLYHIYCSRARLLP